MNDVMLNVIPVGRSPKFGRANHHGKAGTEFSFPTLTMEIVIVSLIALGALVYLLGAVLWPEKF